MSGRAPGQRTVPEIRQQKALKERQEWTAAGTAVENAYEGMSLSNAFLTDRMERVCTDHTDLVGALELEAPAAARTRRPGLAFERKAGAHSSGAEVRPDQSAE